MNNNILDEMEIIDDLESKLKIRKRLLSQEIKYIEEMELELESRKRSLDQQIQQEQEIFMLSLGIVRNRVGLPNGGQYHYYLNMNTCKYVHLQVDKNNMIKYLSTNMNNDNTISTMRL